MLKMSEFTIRIEQTGEDEFRDPRKLDAAVDFFKARILDGKPVSITGYATKVIGHTVTIQPTGSPEAV